MPVSESVIESLDTELEEVFQTDFLSDDLMYPSPDDTLATPFTPLLDTTVLAQVMPIESPDTTAAAIAPRWEEGLQPTPRPDHPSHRSGLLAVIAMMTVLLIYNFRHLRRLMSYFWEATVKIRQGRGNVFDERPSSDIPIKIILVLQAVVCSGILLAGGISDSLKSMPTPGVSPLILHCVGAAAALCLFHYCAYQTVGYIFTTPQGRSEWVRGFTSSQALLGVVLTVPAALAVFYPATLPWMVVAGAFLWLFAKILFIIKGFRIFYDNFSGLLYFILYLCTLEIIPLYWVYRLSVF